MTGKVAFRVWVQRVAHWMPGQLDTVTWWRMVRLWPLQVGVVVVRFDRSRFVRPDHVDDRCSYCRCRFDEAAP